MRELSIHDFEELKQLAGCDGGGQGALFSARYNGQDVVLKFMPHTDNSAPHAYKTLVARTAQIMALGHPGVVRYIGCFQSPAGPRTDLVVVTERLRGETVKQRLLREPEGIGIAEALDMARAVCGTLAELSAAGVMHRDLTPSNIFVEETEAGRRYRLIDFEVGKFIDPASSGQTTTSMAGMGKLNYLAPEVIAVARPTERSDIFSFALTWHEALMGKLPYSDGVMKQANEELCPLPSVDWRVPGLGALLKRCFSHDPAGRPASFAAVREEAARLEPAVLAGKASRYRLVRLIGQGGFGQVYQAEDVDTGRPVALKCLTNNKYADRFEREAKALRAFTDPRIVAYVDYGEHGPRGLSTRFLCMAYLEGMPGASLSDRIKALRKATRHHTGLPEEEVRVAFLRYAGGLGLLHGRKVYHRDIKPANLYLPENAPSAACIMDLGIVRLEDLGANTVGQIPGTPKYMPPEFVEGSGFKGRKYRGSPASDVYSLGLALFEALTGRYLYCNYDSDDTPVGNLGKLAAGQLTPDYAPLERVAPQYVGLVKRMTAFDAKKRVGTTDIVHALEALGRQEAGLPVHSVLAPEPETFPGLAAARAGDDAPTLTQPAGMLAEAGPDHHAATQGTHAGTRSTVVATLPTKGGEDMMRMMAGRGTRDGGQGRTGTKGREDKPPRRWGRYAAALLAFAGAACAAAVVLPPVARKVREGVSMRRAHRAYGTAFADARDAAASLADAVAAASAPADFAPLPARLASEWEAWAGRSAGFAPGVRDATGEAWLSGMFGKAAAAYSNALDRQAQAFVTGCVAAFQGGDEAGAERQAGDWESWRALLAPAAAESQAGQIASAREALKQEKARRESEWHDQRLAFANEPMPVTFEVPDEIAGERGFEKSYDAGGGKWLLATDSLKLPPGAVRFRFARADYEPAIVAAAVESRKPLAVACPAEWKPTDGHARLAELRKALARLHAEDAVKADLDAAVRLAGGAPPALADAGRRGEWEHAAAEVRQTLADYHAAAETRHITEAFAKELHALAAEPSRLTTAKLVFPDEAILKQDAVRAAAGRLVAAVTNRVAGLAGDASAAGRDARLRDAGRLLHHEDFVHVIVRIAPDNAAAAGAAEGVLAAALKVFPVHIVNRAERVIALKAEGERPALDIPPGEGRTVWADMARTAVAEASVGAGWKPAVKMAAAKLSGGEMVFTESDFVLCPVDVTLAAGDASGVGAVLLAADGRLLLNRLGKVEVMPGAYTVRFSRKGWKPQERSVTVKPGEPRTVVPDPWELEKPKTAMLEVKLDGAGDVTATVRSVATGAEVASGAGPHELLLGEYEVTFSREGAEDQAEAFAVVEGRTVVKRPREWKPRRELVEGLRRWAYECRRAEIQQVAAEAPPAVPAWIARDWPSERLLGVETNQLNQLWDLYTVAGADVTQPLTLDKIEEWERLLASGYVPNACDVKLARQVFAVWEEHNRKIQEAAAVSPKIKSDVLLIVGRVRALRDEIVRKTETRKTNENRYAQGNKG